MDKENLLKQSSTVTNQLLSVSRHLANTSQQSLDTLETLCKFKSKFIYNYEFDNFNRYKSCDVL